MAYDGALWMMLHSGLDFVGLILVLLIVLGGVYTWFATRKQR